MLSTCDLVLIQFNFIYIAPVTIKIYPEPDPPTDRPPEQDQAHVRGPSLLMADQLKEETRGQGGRIERHQLTYHIIFMVCPPECQKLRRVEGPEVG